MLARALTLKADAKVRLFFELPNFFATFFHLNAKKIHRLDFGQDRNIYIYLILFTRARMFDEGTNGF